MAIHVLPDARFRVDGAKVAHTVTPDQDAVYCGRGLIGARVGSWKQDERTGAFQVDQYCPGCRRGYDEATGGRNFWPHAMSDGDLPLTPAEETDMGCMCTPGVGLGCEAEPCVIALEPRFVSPYGLESWVSAWTD